MEGAKPVRNSHNNTSDLLTWSEAPRPAAGLHRQPSDGIGNVVFGGQVTDEEQQCLMRRKPSSGYKLKEMTGSGIFAANASDPMAEFTSSNPSRTSVRMVERGSNGISQISFSTEESVAPKKPTSVPEVKGNIERESGMKVKKHVSDANCRELSGHDIFDLPSENPPQSQAAGCLLESKEKTNIEQAGPRNICSSVKRTGGQSDILSSAGEAQTTRRVHNQEFEEPTDNNIFKGETHAVAGSDAACSLESKEKTNIDQAGPQKLTGGLSNILSSEGEAQSTRRLRNQQFGELSGNSIIEGETHTAAGSDEKWVRQAKLREMRGSDIFSDGGKVDPRDHFGGTHKQPPGGDSTIALI